jgi:hypothetical protein
MMDRYSLETRGARVGPYVILLGGVMAESCGPRENQYPVHMLVQLVLQVVTDTRTS